MRTLPRRVASTSWRAAQKGGLRDVPATPLLRTPDLAKAMGWQNIADVVPCWRLSCAFESPTGGEVGGCEYILLNVRFFCSSVERDIVFAGRITPGSRRNTISNNILVEKVIRSSNQSLCPLLARCHLERNTSVNSPTTHESSLINQSSNNALPNLSFQLPPPRRLSPSPRSTSHIHGH